MRWSMAAVLGAAVLSGIWSSAVAAPSDAKATAELRGRPVSLAKIVDKTPRAGQWATLEAGPLCKATGGEAWGRAAEQVQTEALERIFRREMQAGGFTVDGDPDNLFEQPASFGEYAVAGVIKGASGRYCYPTDVSRLFKIGGAHGGKLKAAARLDVEWQIYSRVQRRVIATVETSAGDSTPRPVADRMEPLLEAFAGSVKQLIASQEFRGAFVEAPAKMTDASLTVSKPLIPLAGAATAEAPGVADAISAVVLIFAGEGHGSGFLVSRDGYVMTDQHVIGAAEHVRVRWPDGVEGVGEVVRSDAARDVALIKTDARGREPLPLRTDSLRPGDSVYAIGAPLESRFQSTVTRGVLSAYRTIDGMRYLQSDVTINPGNSGGPLVDERGRVVGMTKSIYQRDDLPVGINFFVPTRDALDFLGAQPR